MFGQSIDDYDDNEPHWIVCGKLPAAHLWAEHFLRNEKDRNSLYTQYLEKRLASAKIKYPFLKSDQVYGMTLQELKVPATGRKISTSFLNKHKTFTRRRNRSTSRTELVGKNRTVRNCNLFEYGDQSSISNDYSFSEFNEIPIVQESKKDVYDDISEWFENVKIQPYRSLPRLTRPSDHLRCDQESVPNLKDSALLNQFRVFQFQNNSNCDRDVSLEYSPKKNKKSILKRTSNDKNVGKTVKFQETPPKIFEFNCSQNSTAMSGSEDQCMIEEASAKSNNVPTPDSNYDLSLKHMDRSGMRVKNPISNQNGSVKKDNNFSPDCMDDHDHNRMKQCEGIINSQNVENFSLSQNLPEENSLTSSKSLEEIQDEEDYIPRSQEEEMQQCKEIISSQNVENLSLPRNLLEENCLLSNKCNEEIQNEEEDYIPRSQDEGMQQCKEIISSQNVENFSLSQAFLEENSLTSPESLEEIQNEEVEEEDNIPRSHDEGMKQCDEIISSQNVENFSLSRDFFEENSFLINKCNEEIQNEEEDHILRSQEEEMQQCKEIISSQNVENFSLPRNSLEKNSLQSNKCNVEIQNEEDYTPRSHEEGMQQCKEIISSQNFSLSRNLLEENSLQSNKRNGEIQNEEEDHILRSQEKGMQQCEEIISSQNVENFSLPRNSLEENSLQSNKCNVEIQNEEDYTPRSHEEGMQQCKEIISSQNFSLSRNLLEENSLQSNKSNGEIQNEEEDHILRSQEKGMQQCEEIISSQNVENFSLPRNSLEENSLQSNKCNVEIQNEEDYTPRSHEEGMQQCKEIISSQNIENFSLPRNLLALHENVDETHVGKSKKRFNLKSDWLNLSGIKRKQEDNEDYSHPIVEWPKNRSLHENVDETHVGKSKKRSNLKSGWLNLSEIKRKQEDNEDYSHPIVERPKNRSLHENVDETHVGKSKKRSNLKSGWLNLSEIKRKQEDNEDYSHPIVERPENRSLHENVDETHVGKSKKRSNLKSDWLNLSEIKRKQEDNSHPIVERPKNRSLHENVDETYVGKSKKRSTLKSGWLNLSEMKRKREDSEDYSHPIVDRPKNRQVDSEFVAGIHSENLSIGIDQNANELSRHPTLSLNSDNSNVIYQPTSAMRNKLEKEKMNNFQSQTNSENDLIDKNHLTSPSLSLFGGMDENVSSLDSESFVASQSTPESLKNFKSVKDSKFLGHSEESNQYLALEDEMQVFGDLKSQEADNDFSNIPSFGEGSCEDGDSNSDKSTVYGSLGRANSDLESISSSLRLKSNIKRKNMDENITSPFNHKRKITSHSINYDSLANTSAVSSSLVEAKKSKCWNWIVDNEMMKYFNTNWLGTSDTTEKCEAEIGCKDEDTSATLSGVDSGYNMDEQNERIDQDWMKNIASPNSRSSTSIEY